MTGTRPASHTDFHRPIAATKATASHKRTIEWLAQMCITTLESMPFFFWYPKAVIKLDKHLTLLMWRADGLTPRATD